MKPSSKSSDQYKSKLKCPCGSKHKYNKTIKYCAYLIPEAAKYWKQVLDPEKVMKVKKRLSMDEDFQKLVEKWRKKYKAPGESSNSTFQISSELKKPFYDLESSWILDSGATIHVCNKISKFIEFNPIERKDEVLWAGESQIQIEGYGKTIIFLKCTQYPNGRPLQLINVAFVPSLHTNVTSLRLLNKVGIHWDTELSILKFNGKHYADTPMLFNQWVLEYNPASIQNHVYATDKNGTENSKSTLDSNKTHVNSSRAAKTQAGSFDDWHIRMGHLYEEALLKLPLVTRGCKMTTAKPEKSVCEECRLSNAKRIVSRVPRTRAIRPFWRVSWDFIQMKEGKNGDVYVQHFVCDYTHMNFIYLLPNKLQDTLMNNFAAFVAYIERRWGFKVVVWKDDGEKSLGSKWAAWINNNGYEVETYSPYTQEQNGGAERSGGLLQAL
ncbi:Gag-Pol polyprotein, partial [Golovinomyces cichoracearum]